MELYYKQAVEGVVQRKERRVALEKNLMSEGGRGMEDWQKAKQLQGLGRRETK
jgi:protein-serine/threonine kinase